MNISGHRSAAAQGLQGKSGRFQGNFSVFKVGLRPIVDFDAALDIILNVADVSDWGDRSGNGNDLAQTTAAQQLLFIASDADFNGQASVEGDGVEERILRTTFVGGVQPQPNTIISVYKFANVVGTEILFDGGGVADRHVLALVGAQASMGNGALNENIHTEDANPHILMTLWNGASSDSFRDGIQTTPAGTLGTDGLQGLTLFDSFSLSNPADVKIPRFLAYNANLSDVAKNYLGRGFDARYGPTWTDI